jgi:hypothetical protein
VKIALAIVCGLGAALVAINLLTLFDARSGWITVILVAPLLEEASKAIAVKFSDRFFVVAIPWPLGLALAFGAGFGGFELFLRLPLLVSSLDVALSGIASMGWHVFLALVLLSCANRNQILAGFLGASFWHGLYNAWALLRADLGLVGLTESFLRLSVVAMLIVFAAPLVREPKPQGA